MMSMEWNKIIIEPKSKIIYYPNGNCVEVYTGSNFSAFLKSWRKEQMSERKELLRQSRVAKKLRSDYRKIEADIDIDDSALKRLFDFL